jgi:hypothetical protein
VFRVENWFATSPFPGPAGPVVTGDLPGPILGWRCPRCPRRPRHVQRFDAPWVADRAPHLRRRLDADDWIKQIKHIQSVSPHYIGNSETQPTLILTPFWTASNGKRDLFTIPPTIVQNHFFNHDEPFLTSNHILIYSINHYSNIYYHLLWTILWTTCLNHIMAVPGARCPTSSASSLMPPT